MELIETSVGLPNTCSICGKQIEEATWFAHNEDEARSGGGAHKACLEPPAPVTYPSRKRAKSEPEE